MKQKLLILWAMLLTSLGAMAQTDVTDLYLTNAGFDDSSSWQSENIAAGGSANSINVAGWTKASSAAWSSSGALGFGTSGQINGVTYPLRVTMAAQAVPSASVPVGAVCASTRRM